MSSPNSPRQRPLSPFMIGPYYKPQLTSMLSIMHRLTGIFLTAGAMAIVYWLAATASGPESFAGFAALLSSGLGKLLFAGWVFSLLFHLFNGIRHLGWDMGWGFEIPRAYFTGWLVVTLSLIGTAWVLYCAANGGGAA